MRRFNKLSSWFRRATAPVAIAAAFIPGVRAEGGRIRCWLIR